MAVTRGDGVTVSDVMLSEILDLPIHLIAARVSAGELSAEAVTRAYLERIGVRDGAIGAWEFLDAESALREAREVDARPGALPLKGVPIGVKDIMDTADLPTGYGSRVYAGHRPVADASCVALARAAGAVVLGKTVSTEFAAASPGRTMNPHAAAHTPGGSSSGSAAAVAAGMVPIALGTQTAGSIVRPASYCGVVGYKPRFGSIDRSGIKPLAGSLDTVGVFSRTVSDAAWFAAILTGRPALADDAPLTAPRIGLYDEAHWDATPESAMALGRAAQALRNAGAGVISLPRHPSHDELIAAQQTIMDWEVPRALAFERLRLFDRLTPMTQEFVSRRPPGPAEYDAAQALALDARAALPAVYSNVDAWLAPAAPGTAPAGLASTGDPLFNRLWTVLHCPCLAIPCITAGGLPVGVQLVAAENDAIALAAAAFLERALKETQYAD